jgi:hypothetical protein
LLKEICLVQLLFQRSSQVIGQVIQIDRGCYLPAHESPGTLEENLCHSSLPLLLFVSAQAKA